MLQPTCQVKVAQPSAYTTELLSFPTSDTNPVKLHSPQRDIPPVTAEAFNDHVKTFTQGDTSVSVSTVLVIRLPCHSPALNTEGGNGQTEQTTYT